MANQLDLQEQEQLDELKAFWGQYGNAITWVLTIALLAYAGWNGWNWWQREQGAKAAAVFEQLDGAAQAGDAQRVAQIFDDLKERYPRTAYAEQGGLLAAKVESDKGQADRARTTLAWVAEHASQEEYQALARLRLAGILADAKQYDDALKQLSEAKSPSFAALVADRRGDILLAQGKRDEAKAAYRQAHDGLDARAEYRRLVEAKLAALGVSTASAGAAQ
jgi:predicted negative regulator of RcsB-dependent stress response